MLFLKHKSQSFVLIYGGNSVDTTFCELQDQHIQLSQAAALSVAELQSPEFSQAKACGKGTL